MSIAVETQTVHVTHNSGHFRLSYLKRLPRILVIRVLAAASPALDSFYARTLFHAEQAYAGSGTARSTIYTASIAAGLMVGQFIKWLRGLPVDPDMTLNLLSAELTAGMSCVL